MFAHKLRTHHRHHEGKAFARLKLFVSLAIAAVAAVYPNFIKGIVGSDVAVGLFYSIVAILSFVVTVSSTSIFQRFKRVSIVNWTLSISIGVYIILTVISSFTGLVLVEILRILSVVFIGLAISLFVRDFSSEKDLGKNEGELFLFDNIGYFLGPLVAGYLAFKFNYDYVFMFAALFSLVAYSYFNYQYFSKKHKHFTKIISKKNESIISNFKLFFSSKENVKSFVLKFGLEYWWVILYFYGPLFIINSGFSEKISGAVIGAITIPLIFMEVFVGKLADKNGYKSYLTVGFFGLSAITILMAYLGYPLLVMALMILASFSVALIEPLQDIHFFRTVPKKDEDRLFGILMLSFSLAQVLAPLLASGLLIFFGAKGVFIGVGVIAFVCGMVATSLKVDEIKKNSRCKVLEQNQAS